MVRHIRAESVAIGLFVSFALAFGASFVASADDDTWPSASPAAPAATEHVALIGTEFLLVGYLASPGGPYVSADLTKPAWLTFTREDDGQRIFDAAVGAYTLAARGSDALGYRLTEADFDARLWAHFSERDLWPATATTDHSMRR